MNHIYKVIFNKATGTFVAVSELARGKSKSSKNNNGVTLTDKSQSPHFLPTTLAIAILGITGQAFAATTDLNNDVICGATGELTDANRADGQRYGEVACGLNAQATGIESVAVGARTKAIADNTIMIGNDIASGSNAVGAIIIGTNLSGYSGTGGPVVSEGITSVAIGSRSNTYGTYGADADGNYSVAIGGGGASMNINGAKTEKNAEYGVAIGSGSVSAGSRSMALGAQSSAANKNAIAVGDRATASGEQAIALGGYWDGKSKGTTANGNQAVAVGSAAEATGAQSLAFGPNTRSGSQSIAIGGDTIASGNTSIAIGADDLDFVISNSGNDYYNLTGTSLPSGYVSTEAKGNGSIAIGAKAVSEKTVSTAIGTVSEAKGLASTALGTSAKAHGDASTAIGSTSQAIGEKSLAAGMLSKASGQSAIAIGTGAQATAKDSISIGTGNVVTGQGSGAIGDPTTITGTGTYTIGNNNGTVSANEAGAFGNNNTLTGSNSRIIGNKNSVAVENTFVVGNGVTATQANSVVLGNASTDKAATAVTNGTVNGITYGTFAGQGSAQNGVLSIGAAGAERQIINVAAGEISATSTDAINGSQLYATNNVLGNVANAVVENFGGNAKLDPTKPGNITFTNIGGTGKDNINDAIEAAKTKVAAGTNTTVDFDASTNTYTVNAAAPKVTTDGTTITTDPNTGAFKANTTPLTNTANGSVNTPNNPNALATAGDIANAINNSGFTAKANGDTGELINPGDSVNFINGKNIKITRTNGDFTIATADDVTFNSVTAGPVTINQNGIDAGNTVISNVASGLNGKNLNQIKNTDAEWNNAATVGDLTKVQSNVTNINTTVNNVNKIIGGTDINGNVTDSAGNALTDKDGNTVPVNANDALRTYDAQGTGTVETNSVLTAVKNINEQGTKYIHVNGGERSVGGTRSKDLDQSQANGTKSTAIGYKAIAGGDNAVAMGNGAQATGTDSISIGTGNIVTGNHSGAIGDPSYVLGDNSYTIGNDNIVANNSNGAFAFGSNNQLGGTVAYDTNGKTTNVVAQYDVNGKLIGVTSGITTTTAATNSTAIGSYNYINSVNTQVLGNGINTVGTANNTQVLGDTVANSVYLGDDSSVTAGSGTGDGTIFNALKDSTTDGKTTTAGATGTVNSATINGITYGGFAGATAVGAVSVGASGAERRIQNVAAGEITATSTDAINGSQLYYTNKAIEEAKTHFYSVNSSSNTAGNYDNKGATGSDALAAGVGTTAVGDYATAVGKGANAGGLESLAFGVGAKATERSATAIGARSEANGKHSLAIGGGLQTGVTTATATKADGNSSIALGYGSTTANGASWSQAIGDVASVGENAIYSIALGTKANVGKNATHSIALGNQATVNENVKQSTVIGGYAMSAAESGTALGYGATVYTQGGIALGLESHATRDAGNVGYDPLTKTTSTLTDSTWKATHSAVSVGQDGGLITRQITNVAAGSADTDAVNVAQLKAVASVAQTTVTSSDNSISVTDTNNGSGNLAYDIKINNQAVTNASQLPVVYTLADGTKVNPDGNGNFKDQAGNIIDTAKNPVITSLQNSTGSTTTPTILTNVANGAVNANSKDAVNGSQLYAVSQGVINNADTIARGINYKGNDGAAINKQLGGTLNIVGTNAGTNTDKGANIYVRTGTNQLTIELAKDLTDLTSTTYTDASGNQTVTNGNGITITPSNTATNTDPVSLTSAGLNNGGNRITNVAPGVVPTDAVNVGQLHELRDESNAGISSAMAMAALPQAYLPGKSMITGGLASYNGEGAVAVGFSKLSDNGRWVLKISGSADTQGNAGGAVGAGFHF